MEASVALGWRGTGAIPFLRASARLGAITASQWRAELAVGVVMPW